jgi:hypothetical protein
MAYSDLNIPADIAAALAAMTPEASLVQLNNAIAKAETSQRYKIADREVQARGPPVDVSRTRAA